MKEAQDEGQRGQGGRRRRTGARVTLLRNVLREREVTIVEVSMEQVTHLGQLKPDPQNARRHNPRNIGMIEDALREVGAARSIVIDEDGLILAGNGVVEAAAQAGIERVQVVEADGNTLVAVRRRGLTEEQKRRLALFDNRTAELAEWDEGVIAELLKLDPKALDGMFTDQEIAALMARGARNDGESPSLADRFLVPPFSVLDARQGYWRERKRRWLALGIESELGRGNEKDYTVRGLIFSNSSQPLAAYKHKEQMEAIYGPLSWEEYLSRFAATSVRGGTSVFDPVLCEVAYRWFCPPGGLVLDPFAGGSVRGIVAAVLGRRYVGVDLRPEQVEANERQAEAICPDRRPTWLVGDSRNLAQLVSEPVDFLFSCPPYFSLERYSDDPADLSNAGSYPDFLDSYRQIVRDSVGLLKADRFACFVVANVRGDDGTFENLVGDTVAAFEDAGAALYNDAILVTSYSSLPVRVGHQFEQSRKLGKTHQNVLVFVKGDARAATEACGPVETYLPEIEENEEGGIAT